MALYDLSHRIVSGMPHFPGDPVPQVTPATMEPPWRVSSLAIGSHTGTHVDAPSHFLPDGRPIGEYPLERFILPGMVVDATGFWMNEAIPEDVLAPYREAFKPGWCLILRTGWDRHWDDESYYRHPYLSDALAAAVVAMGASLFGIDALNVDSTADSGNTVHDTLLRGDVLIVENLRGLDALEAGRTYGFGFVPLALGDVDGAPVRALAWDLDQPLLPAG